MENAIKEIDTLIEDEIDEYIENINVRINALNKILKAVKNHENISELDIVIDNQ